MIILFMLSLVSGDMRVKSPKLLAEDFDKGISLKKIYYFRNNYKLSRLWLYTLWIIDIWRIIFSSTIKCL